MSPVPQARQWIARHVDELIALLVLVWGSAATVQRHSHQGGLALNLAVVAALSASSLLRRRAPMLCTVLTFSIAVISAIWLDTLARMAWSAYLLTIPTYSVAAYCELRPAAIGLMIAISGAAVVDALSDSVISNLLFTTIVTSTSWAVGRAMRHRRALTVELRQRAARVSAEREDRERLAVAGERSRIARELQALVASNVTAMVVQAAAAQRLLDADAREADAAMDEIEVTGREALSEMRKILGVLRRADDDVELAPQPGVEQLHALVEGAREAHREISLRVTGEPGPLPVAVDLAVYRIVEEALAETSGAAAVVLSFDGDEVELEVSGTTAPGSEWPTLPMHERVALCDGDLRVDGAPGADDRLTVRLPRSFQEALA